MLRAIFLLLSRSRLAVRVLLGLRLPPLPPGAHYFDVTTLALVATSRRRVRRGARVVDVGTGSAAVLASWYWRRGCEVQATEIDPLLARQAETCLRHQGAAVRVLRGSLLAGVEGELEFIVFNPPYVPSGKGSDHGRPEAYRVQWDGGPDGTRTIEAFLDAVLAHGGTPTVLLGVHSRHVPRPVVEALFARRPGLRLEVVERQPLLAVDVYVFSSTKSPSASRSNPEE